MAPFRNFPYDLRVLFGYPSQYEKSRLDVEPVEQVQRFPGIFLKAGFETIPMPAVYDLVKRLDVEVVLQDDLQESLFKGAARGGSPIPSPRRLRLPLVVHRIRSQ
jgi:hypothetical protein